MALGCLKPRQVAWYMGTEHESNKETKQQPCTAQEDIQQILAILRMALCHHGKCMLPKWRFPMANHIYCGNGNLEAGGRRNYLFHEFPFLSAWMGVFKMAGKRWRFVGKNWQLPQAGSLARWHRSSPPSLHLRNSPPSLHTCLTRKIGGQQTLKFPYMVLYCKLIDIR